MEYSYLAVMLKLSFYFIHTVSTFTQGEQMIPVLNQVGTHCAVFGNHDFGEEFTDPKWCISY